MSIERASGLASAYVDIVDRVLDKGIVIDPWMRVSVCGIDLMTAKAHLIVASIGTYPGGYSTLRDRPGRAYSAPARDRAVKRLADDRVVR